jgi:transcriptional regulator with XRE-family HTH domain
MNDKDKVYMAFTQRFRQALLELGYSHREQKRLGELFGVSGQAVRKWAEGEALPTSARMQQVAAILGVRRAWLQDGEGTMRPVVARVEGAGISKSGELGEEMLNKVEVDLVRAFRKLNAGQQKAVCDLVRSMVSQVPLKVAIKRDHIIELTTT